VRHHKRNCFIDFVTGLLRINPLERWTPQQAKNHPFITGQEWNSPYNPLAPQNRYTTSPSRPKSKTADPPRRPSQLQSYEGRYEPQPQYDPHHVYYPRHTQGQPRQTQYANTNYLPQHYSQPPQMLPYQWEAPRIIETRPRANTIANIELPPTLREANSRLDPTQIRPSPSYFPPEEIEGIITDDGHENSTSRNIYAMTGYQAGQGARPRKKSTSSGSFGRGTGAPQVPIPPQHNLFRGSARALEDGLMPPWQ
jgi:hypothetical protein